MLFKPQSTRTRIKIMQTLDDYHGLLKMVFILLLFLSLSIGSICANNETHMEVALHKKLFESYNPEVMPVNNISEPMEVAIYIYIWNIDNIDEKKQTFSIRAFLEVVWVNSFLKWNHTEYGGIETINVRYENIWAPDLALTDVYDNPTDLGQGNGQIMVDYNGGCRFWPYKMYQVGCKIRIRKYPFDVQVCELDFMSWSYPTSKLRLTPPEELSLSFYKESVEWAIDHYNSSFYQNPFGKDSWDHVLFTFTLRRKWLFQLINIIAPIVCISLLNPTCFIIPAESGEKITLCLSIFLTLAVFRTLISDALPESSEEVCLFNIYVGLQLACSGLTIVANVISLHLYYKNQSEPVDYYYRLLARLFCKTDSPNHYEMHKDSNESVHIGDNMKTSVSRNTCSGSSLSWISVSQAFDRLCFSLLVIWNAGLVIGLTTSFYSE